MVVLQPKKNKVKKYRDPNARKIFFKPRSYEIPLEESDPLLARALEQLKTNPNLRHAAQTAKFPKY